MTKLKKKTKTRKEQKKEFTPKTRVYDLVKAECHCDLKELVGDISPFVNDVSRIDWKHLRFFEFDENKITKTDFIFIVAQFLSRINKGDGLKCKMSVFIRYLASNEHSNFGLKYRSLNTLICRMLNYIGNGEKLVEKL